MLHLSTRTAGTSRTAEVADLALDLLGPGAIPRSTVGTEQTLDLE